MDFPVIEFSGTAPKFREGKRNFNIFLKRIMTYALEDHQGIVSQRQNNYQLGR